MTAVLVSATPTSSLASTCIATVWTVRDATGTPSSAEDVSVSFSRMESRSTTWTVSSVEARTRKRVVAVSDRGGTRARRRRRTQRADLVAPHAEKVGEGGFRVSTSSSLVVWPATAPMATVVVTAMRAIRMLSSTVDA